MSQPTTTTKTRLWRDELQDPLAPPRRRSRLGRLYAVLSVMLALLGVFCGMLFWLRPAPRPLFVPLWVTRYDAMQIPPVAFAGQDRQALAHFFPNVKNPAGQRGHEILAALQDLEEETQPVVIYLAMQAVRGSKGEILLLPGDAQPDNPATFIPLSQVLDLLKKCPSTSKLLILEIAHESAGPRLGSLSNDVAEAIPAAVAEADDPDLLVLTSCSPGQVALAAPALGRSVFGYYLEQGLRGWADGFVDPRWHDGRVSVKELAAYVQEKVDRWAQLNRGTRQIPMLLGQGKNFLLRACPDSDRDEPTRLPAMPEYPKWLKEAWQTVQADKTNGTWRLTPYLHTHQTALLLRAEQLWRGGVDAESIQSRELAAFAKVQKLLPAKRDFGRPEPFSLAQASTGPVSPALGKDLGALLRDWKSAGDEGKPEQVKAARDKLLGVFLDKHKSIDPIQLRQAVYLQAADLLIPSREDITLLDSLLPDATTKKLQFLEPLVLRQLAKVAATPNSVWPPSSVHLLLQATAMSEQASASIRAFPWNKELLEHAAQLGHNGKIRFWGKEYSSLAEADQYLTDAANANQGILANATAIELASATVDEAMYFLPAYLQYVQSHTDNEPAWLEAVTTTAAVWQALQDPTSVPEQVGARLKELSPRVTTLRQKLDELRQPFTAAAIKHLIAVSQETRATPETAREIDAILTTPFLAVDDRISLWKAGLELSRRLQQKTLDLDDDENRAQQTAGRQTPYAAEKFLAQEQQRGVRQARDLIALLRLAGLNDMSLKRLEKAYAAVAQGKGSDADRFTLADLLLRTWSKDLRDQYFEETDPATRDRLIRLFPPLDGPPGLQADQAADAALVLWRDGKMLWSWLARQHEYLARDYQDSGLDTPAVHALAEFHTRAAAAYQAFAAPVPEKYIQLKPVQPVPLLLAQRPSAEAELQVKVVGAIKSDLISPVPLELLPPGKDWLQVSPRTLLLDQFTPNPAGAALYTKLVPFQVKLLDSAAISTQPPPLGFLAEARLDGKSYHRAIKVPLRGADPVQIILSSNAKEPDPPLDAVRLRPGKIRQKFSVYAYYSGTEPRKVVVQLIAKGEPVRNGEAVLTIGPKEIKPVAFGTGPPPPPKEPAPTPKEGAPKEPAPPAADVLPPLKGDLQVRVLDGDDRTLVLSTRPLDVAIAHPREYVAVSKVQFDPAAPRNLGKNQLSVTLEPLATVPGPDIPAELVLTHDLIPALVQAADGMFKGTLKPQVADPPSTLTLFAKDMKLNPEAEPEGYFAVSVDGYARCFIYRATFATQGDPLTPKAFMQPVVRFATKAYVLSSAKFAVAVEVDNAPATASLQVVLGHTEAGKFVPDVTKSYAAPREQQIGFALDGGLVFEASVADWLVPIDTSQIRGPRTIRATLRDESGAILAYREQVLTIDDTPPDNVKFVKYPAKAQKGKSILVRATGNDAESGIQEAAFFVGAMEGGKIPPKTPLTPAHPVGKGGLTWEAELPLPEDKKGPTDITVVFTNRVGLSSYDTVKVELMDTDPATTGPGAIKGKVMFGDLPQQNLPVFLYNDKNVAIDKTTSDKQTGGFEFANLKPGVYTIYSLNKGSKRDGYQKVTVEANKTATVVVELKLK